MHQAVELITGDPAAEHAQLALQLESAIAGQQRNRVKARCAALRGIRYDIRPGLCSRYLVAHCHIRVGLPFAKEDLPREPLSRQDLGAHDARGKHAGQKAGQHGRSGADVPRLHYRVHARTMAQDRLLMSRTHQAPCPRILEFRSLKS